MYYVKRLLFGFIVFSSFLGVGQSVLFKQNQKNSAYLNFSNLSNFDHGNIELNYLNDWPDLGNVFECVQLNVAVPISKYWHLGGSFLNDKQGDYRAEQEVVIGASYQWRIKGFSLNIGTSFEKVMIKHEISEELILMGESKPEGRINNIGFNQGFGFKYENNRLNKDSVGSYSIQYGIGINNFLEPDEATIVPGSSPGFLLLSNTISFSRVFGYDSLRIKPEVYFMHLKERFHTSITGGIETNLLFNSSIMKSIGLDLSFGNDGGVGLGFAVNVLNYKVKLSKGFSAFNSNQYLTNEFYQISISNTSLFRRKKK